MKTFKITYIRHGSVANYNHEKIIHAVSEKMALKKFWNHKEFGDSRNTKQWMEYERDVNGIWWSDVKAQVIEG